MTPHRIQDVLTFPQFVQVHDETAIATELWAGWNTDVLVLAPLALCGILYATGVCRMWRRAGAGSGVRRGDAAAFAAGWLTLLMALVSPLDALGAELFSAHMVQHEIMMLAAAPLLAISRPIPAWLWGLPKGLRPWAGRLGRNRLLSAPWAASTRPLNAWSIHAAALWVWHIPFLFEAALADAVLHILQHLTFLLSAFIFWWAMIDPRRGASHRLSGVLYIFTTAVHTSILGALLTFSTTCWYPAYASTTATWGLTAIEDQQLGGLIMWVPGGVAFMIVALLSMARFLGDGDSSHHETLPLARRN